MIKWLNRLSKLIVMTVLVSVLTVYVTWMTVHLYVEKLLGQFPLAANMKKLHFSDLWDQMIGDWKGQDPVAGSQSGTGGGTGGGTGSNGAVADNGTESNAAGGDAPVNGSPSAGADGSGTGLDGMNGGGGLDAGTSGSGGGGTGTGAGGSAGGAGGSREEYVPDNALPVFGQSSGADSDALDKKKLIMTAEQFNQKRELLSDADKMRIFTLLLTRLPEEELQKFSQMVEDGISSDDLNAMDSSAQKYLKSEEYEELMDILKKF